MSNKQYAQEEWEEFRKAVNSGDYSRVEMTYDADDNGWSPFIGSLAFGNPHEGWQYRIAPKPPEPEGWSKKEHLVLDGWYQKRGEKGWVSLIVMDDGVVIGGLLVLWKELADWTWTRDFENFYTCTIEPQLVTKP